MCDICLPSAGRKANLSQPGKALLEVSYIELFRLELGMSERGEVPQEREPVRKKAPKGERRVGVERQREAIGEWSAHPSTLAVGGRASLFLLSVFHVARSIEEVIKYQVYHRSGESPV